MKYQTYLLPLPSDGVVAVRKPDRLALAARGLFLYPLLGTAIEAAATEDSPPAADRADLINRACEVCLLDVPADLLPWADRVAVYTWGFAGHGTAQLAEERQWVGGDFEQLVRGPGAILLDAMAKRYGERPSVVLGLDDPMLAMELDLAIAYRGLRHEATGTEGEVEVEDAFGGVHKVPSSWLPAKPPDGARVIKMDDLAATYGEMAFSVGGADSGEIAPMRLQ